MSTLQKLGIAVMALCVSACGRGGSGEPAATAAAPVQPAAVQEAPAPAAQGRDISALRACELVTPSEVAAIVGGKLLAEPPAGFPNCSYVIEVDGGTESYHVAYSEPAALQALVDYETANGPVERLEALWDEAVVLPRDAETGGGFEAIAIRKGDVAVEAWGERKEPVVAIARLAVSRLD